MSLVFPVSAGTTAIEVAGHALEEPSGRVLQYLQSVVPDWRFCEIPTVDAAGVEMKFTIASTSPVEIYVGDKSFSLPTEGLPIAAARPADTIASQDGDVTLVTRLVKLEPSVPLPGAKAHR